MNLLTAKNVPWESIPLHLDQVKAMFLKPYFIVALPPLYRYTQR
jgi:hypothetical protein